MNILIRDEQNTDIQAIFDLTQKAFNDVEHSSHTEQFIVNALRESKQLTVSLVAETQGKVIGHIAFSPVSISDGTTNWYGLGPISVLPEYQVAKIILGHGFDKNSQMVCKLMRNHIRLIGCYYARNGGNTIILGNTACLHN